MTTYVFRSQAVEAARKAGYENFRTYQDADGMWRASYEPGESPAIEYATLDYVSHVETDWDRSGVRPVATGVLVVTCRLDEIPESEREGFAKAGIRLEPLTPSLWDRGETKTNERKGVRHAPTGTRARSSAASPVAIVWRLASEMTGSTRTEVIAACVAEGVNKSTASTQYYRWQKAKTA